VLKLPEIQLLLWQQTCSLIAHVISGIKEEIFYNFFISQDKVRKFLFVDINLITLKRDGNC
jgi:hypothetical protein